MAVIETKLVEGVAAKSAFTPPYAVYMAVSGSLAAVGMLSNSVPILIGAMVVAPALPPFALVAFALVARDVKLAARGLAVGLGGVAVATLFALITAWAMSAIDIISMDANLLQRPLLGERLRAGWWSLAAAVAAGIAGVLALCQQKQDTLIGTVAALAIVPAAAAGGIAMVTVDFASGLGGLLLLAMNVALIIAMGVLVLIAWTRTGTRRTGHHAGQAPLVRPATSTPLLLAFSALVISGVVWGVDEAVESDRVLDQPPTLGDSGPILHPAQIALADEQGALTGRPVRFQAVVVSGIAGDRAFWAGDGREVLVTLGPNQTEESIRTLAGPEAGNFVEVFGTVERMPDDAADRWGIVAGSRTALEAHDVHVSADRIDVAFSPGGTQAFTPGDTTGG